MHRETLAVIQQLKSNTNQATGWFEATVYRDGHVYGELTAPTIEHCIDFDKEKLDEKEVE